MADSPNAELSSRAEGFTMSQPIARDARRFSKYLNGTAIRLCTSTQRQK